MGSLFPLGWCALAGSGIASLLATVSFWGVPQTVFRDLLIFFPSILSSYVRFLPVWHSDSYWGGIFFLTNEVLMSTSCGQSEASIRSNVKVEREAAHGAHSWCLKAGQVSQQLTLPRITPLVSPSPVTSRTAARLWPDKAYRLRDKVALVVGRVVGRPWLLFGLMKKTEVLHKPIGVASLSTEAAAWSLFELGRMSKEVPTDTYSFWQVRYSAPKGTCLVTH